MLLLININNLLRKIKFVLVVRRRRIATTEAFDTRVQGRMEPEGKKETSIFNPRIVNDECEWWGGEMDDLVRRGSARNSFSPRFVIQLLIRPCWVSTELARILNVYKV